MVDFDTLILQSVDEALDLIVGDKNGGAEVVVAAAVSMQCFHGSMSP